MQKKNYYTLFCLFCLLFFSCSKRESTLISVKEIIFNIDSPPVDQKIFYDKNNIEYLSFADYFNKSKLSIFTMNGKLKKEISLKEILKSGEEIDHYFIKSFDTLVVLGRYSNRIWFINGTGKVYKQLNLNSIVPDKINKYEFFSSANNNLTNDNLTLFAAWRSNSNDTEPKKDKEYIKYFSNRENNSYSFLQLNNIFNNGITSRYKIKGFNKQFEKNDVIAHINLPLYTINNNNLLVYSIHSDTIYNYDLKTYKLKRKIKITSDFTTIGEQGYNIDKETIDRQTHTNNIAYFGGVLGNVSYDRFRKLYYVIVPHKIEGTKEPQKKKLNRPFSVIIYNNKWKKLNENIFQAGKYDFYDTMICKDGLLISKNIKENKNYNPKIARYELFKVIN